MNTHNVRAFVRRRWPELLVIIGILMCLFLPLTNRAG